MLRVENGHDGGRALTIAVAPFRLACLNGMLVKHGVSGEWKARHTSRMQDGWQEDARRSLRLAGAYYDRLEEMAERMLRVPVHTIEFERFVRSLVPLPVTKPGERQDRAVGNAERAREAIRTCWRADDLANVQHTAYGAYQAVTAYVDHVARLHGSERRSASDARFERQVGSHKLKDRAFMILAELGAAVAA